MMEKGNILIVEDDLNLGFLLMEHLQNEGYRIRLGRDGLSGLELMQKEHFDLCIFDIMMPKIGGFDLARHLKNLHPNTPFLFITARILKEDKLLGYNLGAEDYIIKPFDEQELICKMKVILRRNAHLKFHKEPSNFKIGKYLFDFDRMELAYETDVIRMTDKESKVLKQLCLHKNRILKRDEAVESIYGKKDYFHGRSFDVFISKLRKLLKKDPRVSIDNVFNVGFILNVSDENQN